MSPSNRRKSTTDDAQPPVLLNSNGSTVQHASRKRKHGESVDADSVDEHSDDKEVTVVKKLKKSSSPSKLTALLKALGRHIGRYISYTASIQNSLLQTHLSNGDNEGDNEEGDDDGDDEVVILAPYQAKIQERIFNEVNARHRRLVSDMNAEALDLLSTELTAGLRDAHNQDVRSLKRHIISIYTLVDPPAKKVDWGFQYECTARLLRPVDVTEGSLGWDELCAGNNFPKPDVWPAFMWDGRCGPTDEADFSQGFLMDSALIKVARVVLFPPSFVDKTMAAATGYAKDWDIKAVSSNFIAYVVELTRFSLSSEHTYANVDFDYTKFYDGIVAQLTNPDLREQTRRIHTFWNEKLFSNVAPPLKRKKATSERQPKNQPSTTAMFLAQVSRVEKENRKSTESRLATLATAAVGV